MKLSRNRCVFSDRRLEELPVPVGAHVHYYDSQCPVLAVRVTASGRKSFKAHNRAGSPQFIAIAEVGEIGLEEARVRAQDILRSMRETGLTPKEQQALAELERQKEKRLDVTLGEALDQYLAVRTKAGRKRSIKQITADNMRREVRKYLEGFLDQPLRSLTYAVLHEQHEAIIERHAPSVADRVMRNVGTLIRYIEEREEVHLFGHNPARKVLRLDGHEFVARKTHLPIERFPDFFEALVTMDDDAADFLRISLFTGLRAGSVKTLRWDLIDLDRMALVLTEAKGRKDESASLPLSRYVVSILRKRKARAGDALYVFPSADDSAKPLQYHDTIMDRLWQAGGGTLECAPYHVHDRDGKPRYGKDGKPVMGKKRVLSGQSDVCNQRGSPLIHHDLRRTFCSVAALAAGVDVFTAMSLSLHKFGGGATSVHADYVQLEPLRPGLEAITEVILRLGERPAQRNVDGSSNVVAFLPRRSASLPPSRQDDSSPAGVA